MLQVIEFADQAMNVLHLALALLDGLNVFYDKLRYLLDVVDALVHLVDLVLEFPILALNGLWDSQLLLELFDHLLLLLQLRQHIIHLAGKYEL